MTIMIIQEISIEHNFRAKSWVQCSHKKTQNGLPIKNKQTNKQTSKSHHNYHTMDDRTIIQSATAGKVDNPETTNCTSVNKHVIK